MHARRSTLAPLGVALAVMVVWGGTPVLSKIALREIGPLDVGLLRTVLAGLAAAPLLAAGRVAPPAGAHSRALVIGSGFAGFVAFPLLYTVGQERTSAMHAGLILAALPVATGGYAALVYRRRPGRRWLAGSAVALAGEVALIALRGGHGGSKTTLAGDLLVLVSMLVVAGGYVAGAGLGLRGYGSLPTTLWGVVLSTVAMGPVLGASVAARGWPSAGPGPWAAVVTLAIATSIIGYISWYWALARGGIQRIATMQFLQPFSGLVLAALVLGERLTLALALASIAILVGVSVALRR